MEKIKLNFMHVCDYASLSDGGKLNAMGIFKNISGSQLPITQSQMYVVSNITVPELKEYVQTLKLIDNDSIDVIPPIKLSANVTDFKSRDIGLLLQLNSIKFEKEGEYKFILDVNNEKVTEVSISISLNK